LINRPAAPADLTNALEAVLESYQNALDRMKGLKTSNVFEISSLNDILGIARKITVENK
jgi:hypothetical protein